MGLDFSKQYRSLPNYKEEEDKIPGLDYSQLLSRPEDMNYSPVSQPKPQLDLMALEAPENKEEIRMSGRGPAMDLTAMESPDAKAMVADYLKKKYEPAPQKKEELEMPEYHENSDELARADERGSRREYLSSMGMGLNQIIKGISGASDVNNDYYKTLLASSDKPLANAQSKQKSVRDYLRDKYEMGMKKKFYEKELAEMQDKRRHEGVMEGLAKEELGIKNKKQSMELPEGVKKSADQIAEGISNKVITATQIDSYANQMDEALKSGDKSTALQMGRQMIKVLNSTEGKDAVGQEEANRLASKLEFALGNFTNNNPTQFGRDLEGFLSDARTTSGVVKDAAKNLKETYKSVAGREHPIQIPAAAGPKNGPELLKYEDPDLEREYQEYKRKNGG